MPWEGAINDLLQVPFFARLADYLGLWSVEPAAFAALRQMAAGINLQAHVAENPEPLKSATEMTAAPGGKSIAIVKATGLLMKSQSSFGGTSTIQLRREIRTAANDPQVAGILLAIDSPGGTVAGTDDLAKEIKAAGKQKPVWAHIEDLGASAAYWMASQADKVTVNSPTALVGSIGTFQVIYDQSAAAEQQGVKTLLFATGPLKGLGTMGSKVTDEQVTHVQALVESVQTTFDAAVRSGRQMSAKELTAVRHGGVMTGNNALDAKLVDAVQPLSKTLSDFASSLKDEGRPKAVEVGVAAGVLPMIRQRLPMLT